MTGIIIVTHGNFGAYLLEACEHIVGYKENVRSFSIISKMGIDEAKQSIKKITDEILHKCDSIIYLVDIPGGTPMNIVLNFAKDIKKSAVICGVNMSMLIVAMNLKDIMEFDALVEKIVEDGKRSISEVKSILLTKDSDYGNIQG
jgi:mannose/fructose-specific phosphotransferase system component IIA